MMRTIWVDRPRLDRRKISLTAVLSKIETFRANMAAKYDHLIDDRVPLQKYAKIVKVGRCFSVPGKPLVLHSLCVPGTSAISSSYHGSSPIPQFCGCANARSTT